MSKVQIVRVVKNYDSHPIVSPSEWCEISVEKEIYLREQIQKVNKSFKFSGIEYHLIKESLFSSFEKELKRAEELLRKAGRL